MEVFRGYNLNMQRSRIRAAVVILLLVLSIGAPIVYSGYSELKRAGTAGSYSEAAVHYKVAAQRIPWRADLYELSGHAYFHAKDYVGADEMYRTAFERKSLSPEGWAAWGDVNYLKEDPDRAVEIWMQALEQDAIDDGVYLRLGYAAQEKSDIFGAVNYYKTYASKKPEDAAAHYQLGLLLSLSDPASASAELISASQLDPRFDPAAQTLRTSLNLASLTDAPSERYLLIGRGLGLVEEWGLARAAFQSAVDSDKNNAEAWAWYGEANQHAGLDGTGELDRALELDPNSATVRGLRGLYFQRTANYRQALLEFQAAASFEPENPARYVSLGDAYGRVGDLIRALEAFQYATTLAPEEPAYWRALALFCGQNVVHIDDVGIRAAQQAVILDRGDSSNQDVLGWLYLLEGQYADSERHMLEAVQMDPRDSSAHLHLGMLYLQTGERDKAFEHLITARDLGDVRAKDLLVQYFP